ncbi:MAG: DUF2225 domain-containing protein [Candidatus Hydrogenedentota bacterium]|nr:MAG: DUF2225 domain-containing protein [Candidatus Hydrogenedentota bacterium]
MTQKSSAPKLPPEKLEILRQLNEAFQGDRSLIAAYLKEFGWSKVVAPNIRLLKRKRAEAVATLDTLMTSAIDSLHESAPAVKDASPAGKDPYFRVAVTCPYCEAQFPADVLRSKSLVLMYNYKDSRFPLLVPEASSSMKGYRVEDPLLRDAIVCPRCLYASTQLGSFRSDSALSGSRGFIARLPQRKFPAVKRAVDAHRKDRESLLARELDFLPTPEDWLQKRTPALAAVAEALASDCHGLLAEFDSSCYYQAGEALLKRAKILNDLGRTDQERRALSASFNWFEKAYEYGKENAASIYLLGVIAFHLGDDRTARTWIGRILTDRGKIPGALRFRRYCEDLNEVIKTDLGLIDSDAETESSPET